MRSRRETPPGFGNGPVGRFPSREPFSPSKLSPILGMSMDESILFWIRVRWLAVFFRGAVIKRGNLEAIGKSIGECF
jgi:hypothetical protein